MKQLKKYCNLLLIFLGFSFFMLACMGDEPLCDNEETEKPTQKPDEPSEPGTSDENPDGIYESTTLVYAVASNNLGPNIISDKNEMLRGASDVDLNKNNVLVFETRFEDVYSYTSEPMINLLKLVKKDGEFEWETIKEYSTEVASLDPARIREIIGYVIENYKAESYGLIFWSHSTASTPYNPSRSTVEAESLPQEYSFGEDKIYGNGADYYQINVDDLAEAVPSNVFDYIWFDSCYMSNIESIYQFRGKCNYYVGYPTEVLDAGMPYHYTLPLLAKKDPDVVEAAKKFFVYYDTEYYLRIATIALIDMKKLDVLKDFCKSIYKNSFETPKTSQFSLHKYTNNRQTSGPFYDLGDYTKAMASLNGNELSNDEWDSVLSQCVLYKAATPSDFNGRYIEQDRYSGISTYIYNRGENSVKEEFYEGLDWFKSVFVEDSTAESEPSL